MHTAEEYEAALRRIMTVAEPSDVEMLFESAWAAVLAERKRLEAAYEEQGLCPICGRANGIGARQ